MYVFSLILFMVITTAFVFFNGVAINPLVHLLHITNKTDQLKNEKKENEFCSIVRSWFILIFLYIKEKKLFENNFKSNRYG